MPYNNTPITPSHEVSGSTSLPLARVKKIIKADPDTGDCSNNAAFAIAIAAEMFLQHMVERAHNVVKTERRPRKNIQYKDVGMCSGPSRFTAAVGKNDNLEFLTDVVPSTITFRDYKKKKAREAGEQDESITNGQQKLEWGGKQFDGAEDMTGSSVMEHEKEARTTNGASATQESPGSSRKARHSFDAVHDAHETGPAPDLAMDED